MILANHAYGNYRGAGWTLMGFEDRHAFTPPFGYYDREYTGFVPYAGLRFWSSNRARVWGPRTSSTTN
jgi:hypothetical protein